MCVVGKATMPPDWLVFGLDVRSRGGTGQQVQKSRWGGMEDEELS